MTNKNWQKIVSTKNQTRVSYFQKVCGLLKPGQRNSKNRQ
jgi:hypothetical protein